MSCVKDIDNIIYHVEKISNSNKNVYIFVGLMEDSIKSILKKIENKENIKNKEELNILKTNFKNELQLWLKYIKDKVKIKFIYNLIRNNDSLSVIKKKIFYYCSNNKENKYIIPENQELWVKDENNNYEIIGPYYEDSNRNKIKILPFVYEKSNNIKKLRQKKFTINNSESNTLIYDLLDYIKIKENIIYFTDIKEIYDSMKSKFDKNDYSFIVKKHFPYMNLNYNLENVKKDFLLKGKMYEKELNIDSIFNKYKNNNKLLGDCNIIYMIFKVNELLNQQHNFIPIDLYQVFDYLRDKKLDNQLPYIKYGDESFDVPLTLLSKEAIKNEKISKKTVIDWMGLNRIGTKINGIMLKKYLKDINNEAKYISLILRKNNEITIKLSFDSSDEIKLDDVSNSLKNSKIFVDEINKNIVSKKINVQPKIEPPDISIQNDIIKLKENTKLKFCNIYIPFLKKENFDFKELYDFSKSFPEYIYDEFKDANERNKQRLINGIKLRYKKISGFIPMSMIIKDIDILKSKEESDFSIIQIISKKYSKTQEDVQNYMIEWKNKYSSYMTRKIESEYKIGVEIEITNSSVKLNQITNFYQINMIYNFVKNFLLMFLKEKKNKNINNIFNKNLNKNILNNDDFVISYNKKKMENFNFNNNFNVVNLDLLEDELYDNNIKNKSQSYNSSSNTSNFSNNLLINSNTSTGVSKEDDIAPELRLKCDDAIPEQGRCADACNDPSYYLRRLQMYDNYLFRFHVKNNKEVQYSTRCGAAQGRQPIVLISDPSDNPKVRKDAYTYSLKYSSKPEEFQRWYICPNIWCPGCEIPIAKEEINEKTIQRRVLRRNGAQCVTALCPYNNSHQVIIRETNQIYPGFLSIKHPDKYHCLPCCFAFPQNSIKYKQKFIQYKKCLGEDVENGTSKNGLIYILGKVSPIEKDRYGTLPTEVGRILNTRLETGYLELNKGYLKKGIKHKKNQSFISCLINIISCTDKMNINEETLKNILIEKLNVDLFRSLSNLEKIFDDPKHNLTAIDNFKKYLKNENVFIDHKYLWDYIQRENILFKEGVNLIIFDNNRIVCPLGENIYHFYDESKKTIMMLKTDNYYEPIYYLEGNGKSASKKCIYNSELIEIKKILEISKNECSEKYTEDWEKVLKKNIIEYNLENKELAYKFDYDLLYVINELLNSIKSKKLGIEFIPKLQYMDSYNKIYGLVLKNGLYLPIKPSKLLEQLSYKVKPDLDSSDLMDYKFILSKTQEINKHTNLKYKIDYKILDNKEQKYIIALLNNNNRIIPVKKINNIDKSLKISNKKYFSDINEFISQKIIINDRRVEKINKKNFEDETFNRLRYELSIFLQKNKNYLEKVKNIIYNNHEYNNKDLKLNRKKMYLLLNEIFSKITSTNEKKIDFFTYKTPNKRIPCWMLNTKENKSNHKLNHKSNKILTTFSCDSDPHCINVNQKCKLYIHKKNLIDLFKNVDNYQFYLSKLLDELLRYKIKRDEILNNDIDNIIDKNYIPENDKKYIIIQTFNTDEIKNKLNELFFNNFGIYVDTRKLYEESTTRQFAFNKNLYLKEEYKNENIKYEELSGYWSKMLGNKFKVKDQLLNIFEIIKDALNSNKDFFSRNKDIDVSEIKADLVKYWSDKVKDSRNVNKIENNIYKEYKDNCARKIKNILNYEDLMNFILGIDYKGCFIDFNIFSKIYNVNLVFLEKRIKKNNNKQGFNIIKSNQSNYYILIYESIINNQSIYHLIGVKNKFLFYLDELTPKFIQEILGIN